MNLKPGLYIVSTPIGNLEDITIRALKMLQHSDLILCEDTRVSNKLLAKHGINKPLIVYNENSDEKNRQYIQQLLDQGKILSLISDAGTPLISDPGYKLIRDLKKNNYHIDVLPGANSILSALVLSGLPTDRFLFAGFLPKTTTTRQKIFTEFKALDASLIFFDTANRLVDSLQIALEILGNREASIARELTKLFQESKSASLRELIEYYTNNPPRGEIVMIISGKFEIIFDKQTIKNEITTMLNKGVSAKNITEELFENYKANYSKKELYKLVNEQK